MGAAFGDYDLDGDLDLAVTAWGTQWRDELLIYNPNPLFRNDGDGTFTEVTRQAGVFSLRTLASPRCSPTWTATATRSC